MKQRRRESGEVGARPPIKKTPPKWHAYKDRLIGIVQRQPDITLRELRDQLGADISPQTLSVALRRLKYPLKKKSSGRASRTGPMSRRSARCGGWSKGGSIRSGWFFSTKPGPRPT